MPPYGIGFGIGFGIGIGFGFGFGFDFGAELGTFIHTYIHAYIHAYIDSYEYSDSGEAIVAGVVALKFFQQNACEDDDWRSRGTVERVSETQDADTEDARAILSARDLLFSLPATPKHHFSLHGPTSTLSIQGMRLVQE